jgi:16S rRNA processing protein RimM
MSNPHNTLLHIATLGRTVGLRGDMKLHIKSDFPEQFVAGAEFVTQRGERLRIAEVNPARETVRIDGIDSPEAAKRLINVKLFTTEEATREQCTLEEGEYFWFDIIGCEVREEGRLLGVVKAIERIGVQDYLSVRTDGVLVEQGESKNFLIPYHEPFIVETDIAQKRIEVKGAFDILQAS